MNTFNNWLRDNNVQKSVIVFSDWHETRSNIYLTQKLTELEIYLITFVSNTTHFSQPLDIAFFGPLKKRWGTYAKAWSDTHPNQVINKNNFNTIFIPFLLNHFKYSSPHVINGFKITGLISFCVDNCDYSKLIVKKKRPSSMSY